MKFVSVDVETANYNRGSICQIGWAIVEESRIVEKSAILIDPQEPFDPFNVEIHGIDEEMVRGAPSFTEVKESFRELFFDVPVISYGLFDRDAFALADDNNSFTSFAPGTPWINAQRIVRRAWPDHFKKKYNLRLVADTLGLKLEHHDAGSDAEVTARAVVLAGQELGLSFDELMVRAYQPLTARTYDPIRFEGREKGTLSGAGRSHMAYIMSN